MFMKTLFKGIILLACIILPCLSIAQKKPGSEGVDQRPDLRISKEGPRMAGLTQPVGYKIIITNNGDGPAKTMELVETLPSNLDYVSSRPQGFFKPPSGDTLATVS